MNKRILIPVALLLLLVPALVTVPAEGADWLNGWDYCKNVTITGQTGAGTNYQVLVEVPYDAHMQADFADIRFTSNDGVTLLDHWRETYTASTTATFWVEVKDSLETSATIRMYYGNSEASTASNGNNTFFFFDDFENNNLDKWDSTSDASTQSTTVKYGTYAAMLDYSGAGAKIEVSSNFQDLELDTGEGWYMIHAWLRSQSVTRGAVTIGFSDDSTTEAYFGPVMGYEATTSKLYTYNGSYVAWNATDDLVAATWYRAEWAINGVDTGMGYFDYYQTAFINRVSRGTIALVESDGSDIETNTLAAYRISGYSSAGYDVWIDDVYVRKWVSGDCAVSGFGAEQEEPDESWHEVAEAELWFTLLANSLSGWYVLVGMIAVVGAPTYLAVAKKAKSLSLDKFFIFLVVFIFGWAMIIGGIGP